MKQIRNELKVSVPRGSGGSPSHSRIGRQIQKPGPHCELHRLGVDQFVHDPKSAGHMFDA